jgi:hypothetical protein
LAHASSGEIQPNIQEKSEKEDRGRNLESSIDAAQHTKLCSISSDFGCSTTDFDVEKQHETMYAAEQKESPDQAEHFLQGKK